jgi:hypothetical protein
VGHVIQEAYRFEVTRGASDNQMLLVVKNLAAIGGGFYPGGILRLSR